MREKELWESFNKEVQSRWIKSLFMLLESRMRPLIRSLENNGDTAQKVSKRRIKITLGPDELDVVSSLYQSYCDNEDFVPFLSTDPNREMAWIKTSQAVNSLKNKRTTTVGNILFLIASLNFCYEFSFSEKLEVALSRTPTIPF